MFEKISYKKDNLLFYLLVGGGLILVAQGEVEGAKEAAAGGFESGYETLTTEVTDGANKAKKGCCGGYTKCNTCCTKGCIIS